MPSPGRSRPLPATPQSWAGSPGASRAPLGGRAAGMPPGETSPRLRKVLASGYESRHGQGTALFQDGAATAQPCATPRMRKAGLREFTDAKNPFSRVASKQVSRTEECRKEKDRAGAPTRNPGMMPVEQFCGERQKGEDGRFRLVPHRYGNQEWRISKKPVSDAASPAAAAERACASWTRPSNGSGVLENYLNDMKRVKQARGPTPAAPPSLFLERMNDARVQLPADRQRSRARSHSCEPATEECRNSQGPLPRARSVSQSPLTGGDGENSEKYGFTRKHTVNAHWTQGRSDLLHHEGSSMELASPGTPRTPGSTRAIQANDRFEEMMSHMKANHPEQRRDFQLYKAKDKCTSGLLASDQVVLHPPSERRPKLGAATPRSWCQASASSPRSPEAVAASPVASTPSAMATLLSPQP